MRLLLVCLVTAAQAAPEASYLRWSLKKGQKFELSAELHQKEAEKVLHAQVSGDLVITDVTKTTVTAEWNVSSYSHHQRFVQEERLAFKGGKWSMDYIPHVARDEKDAQEMRQKRIADWQADSPRWTTSLKALKVELLRGAISVDSAGVPLQLDGIFSEAVPLLPDPATAAPKKLEELPSGRYGMLIADLELKEKKGTAKYASTGKTPVYLEQVSFNTAGVSTGKVKVAQTVTYERRTTYTIDGGYISSVNEKYDVATTADGKPLRTGSGTCRITFRPK